MVQPAYIASTPEEVGVSSARLEQLFARVRKDVDEGLQGSAAVAIARNGKIAGAAAFGKAVQGGVLRQAKPDTLYHLYSATKGIMAISMWPLFEQGKLTTDQKVCEIIPEFGTNGKDVVTVEQLLLMTSGFPLAPHRPSEWADRGRLIERFQQWRLTWEPDSKWEYHFTSSHWVETEIVERLTGKPYGQWLHEAWSVPSGAETLHIGLPRELHEKTADVYFTNEPESVGEATPESIYRFNYPDIRDAGNPGMGGIGSAMDAALYYAPLVNGGLSATGERLLKPETIADMTRVRTKAHHLNQTSGGSGFPVNRGLGVVVAGADGFSKERGFGSKTSPRAFGHAGAGGQLAWADPETGISFGYVTNAHIPHRAIDLRTAELSDLAAVCAS